LELKSQQIVNADVLVLGGGAGLSAAIEARKHGVGVLQVFERVRKAVNDMVKDCQVKWRWLVFLLVLEQSSREKYKQVPENNACVKCQKYRSNYIYELGLCIVFNPQK